MEEVILVQLLQTEEVLHKVRITVTIIIDLAQLQTEAITTLTVIHQERTLLAHHAQ